MIIPSLVYASDQVLYCFLTFPWLSALCVFPIHICRIVGMMWNSSYIRMLSSLSPSTLISLGLDFRNIPVNESGSVVPTPTPGSEFYVDTGSKLYFGGGPRTFSMHTFHLTALLSSFLFECIHAAVHRAS